MILKLYDVEFLNIEKDKVAVGDTFLVENEFDKNAKFPKSLLVGTIKMKDETSRLLSLNKSSYRLISEIYGADTKGWIGKTIVYKGIQKLGAMDGKVFDAVR